MRTIVTLVLLLGLSFILCKAANTVAQRTAPAAGSCPPAGCLTELLLDGITSIADGDPRQLDAQHDKLTSNASLYLILQRVRPQPAPGWLQSLLMTMLHLIRQAWQAAGGGSSSVGSTAAPGSHANTLDHAAAMQAAGMVHHAAGVLSHSALVRAAAWSKVGLKADLAAPGPPMGSPAVRGHPGPAATTLSSQLPAVEPSTYSAGGVKQVADAQGGEVCNASSTSTSNSTSVVLDSSSQAAATAQLPNSPLLQGRQRQRHEQAATSAPSLSSQLQRLLHTMLVLEQASQTSAGPSAASLTSRRHQIAAEGGGDTPERRQQELKLAAMLRSIAASLEAAGGDSDSSDSPSSSGPSAKDRQQQATCPAPSLLAAVQEAVTCSASVDAAGSRGKDSAEQDVGMAAVALSLMLPGLVWMFSVLSALASLPSAQRQALARATVAPHAGVCAPSSLAHTLSTPSAADQQEHRQQGAEAPSSKPAGLSPSQQLPDLPLSAWLPESSEAGSRGGSEGGIFALGAPCFSFPWAGAEGHTGVGGAPASVQLHAVQAVQAGLVLARYQDQVMRLEAQHREEMACMHSAYSSSLRQLQEGGADATSYPPAIPPACEAGDCDSGSLDVGAALDQSLSDVSLLARGTGTGTLGPAGPGGQRGKGAGEAGSLMVATGGRSKGMSALGSGGDLALGGCEENGQAWAPPGVLRVRLHSGRDGAGADSEAGEAAEAARGLTRKCGAFSMQLTAAAAMAASLRRAAEGQAHTWQRLQASLPATAAAGGAGATGGGRGGAAAAGGGRLAAAGSGAEGVLGAGEKVLPCERSLGSRAQDEVPHPPSGSPIKAPVGSIPPASGNAHTPVPAALAAGGKPPHLHVPASPLGKPPAPGTPNNTRAALQQLQERLSASYRKQMDELEAEHMRTLQTLSESHQSQLSRLATQLHQQQREAEALRQQLGTMQQHGSSAVASVAASLL